MAFPWNSENLHFANGIADAMVAALIHDLGEQCCTRVPTGKDDQNNENNVHICIADINNKSKKSLREAGIHGVSQKGQLC